MEAILINLKYKKQKENKLYLHKKDLEDKMDRTLINNKRSIQGSINKMNNKEKTMNLLILMKEMILQIMKNPIKNKKTALMKNRI